MRFTALVCPKCGGPLPPNAKRAVVVCGFCGASVSVEEEVVYAAKYRRALREMDADAEQAGLVSLGGLPYRVLGRLAQGDVSDVFLAERARRISEKVVIKVVREAADGELLEREASILSALQESSARGTRHFRRLVPEPIHRGSATLSTGVHPVAVLRYRPGFAHTLSDIVRAYPAGVDPRHAVWIWRRTLEVLSWLHRAGVAHGAPLPEHLLVHTADHGVMLVGFSCAARLVAHASLFALNPAHKRFYPEPTLAAGRALDAATDLVVAARSIRYLLSGGRDALPDDTPQPLAELVRAYADAPVDGLPTADAFELRERVGLAARQAFGPPRFVHLHMPARAGA